ncbi:hypothetical protein QQP08_014793 [Theobroma cacao]|nr:hypothetical protein QQP08_014793 [Theobroma cacao]
MDIDPFWITGGHWFICHSNFMATANKSSICETSTKSHVLLLLFLVLLLISPLFARPAYMSKVPICSSYRQLLSSSTTNLHPFSTSSTPAATSTTSSTTSSSTATTDRQFKAAAHEVPSGPNPESNNFQQFSVWNFCLRCKLKSEPIAPCEIKPKHRHLLDDLILNLLPNAYPSSRWVFVKQGSHEGERERDAK